MSFHVIQMRVMVYQIITLDQVKGLAQSLWVILDQNYLGIKIHWSCRAGMKCEVVLIAI